MAEGGLQELRRALALKRALAKSIERRLEGWKLSKARGDGHSRRLPRPCGLTIHTCVGCPFSCIYCYIEDLGFPQGRSYPYALSSLEWSYALLWNPSFLPGAWGTYLAYGSICEPLHGGCTVKTLEYLKEVEDSLGNPCQIATKSSLSDEVVESLARLRRISLNILVTLVTLRYHKVLEPSAPTPEDRLETIKKLRRKGVPVFLFLRPLIPGLAEKELEDLMKEAKQAGALGVVLGGLRVSSRILRKLDAAGLCSLSMKTELNKKLGRRRLLDIPLFKLKAESVKIAREVGLIPFRSACCATTFSFMQKTSQRVPCAGLCFTTKLCTENCPVKCRERLPSMSVDDVKDALTLLLDVKPERVGMEDKGVTVYLKEVGILKGVPYLFSSSFRRRLWLKVS